MTGTTCRQAFHVTASTCSRATERLFATIWNLWQQRQPPTSTETLLMGAVADCFLLTIRAITRASHLSWLTASCEVVGTLEHEHGASRFTAFALHARLRLPLGSSVETAERLLQKA